MMLFAALSWPRARRLSPVVCFLGTCFFSACTSFDDPSTVLDLRLLAVKAEPSEIVVTDPAAPLPSIKLWPLLADHDGDVSDATFSVVGCPNTPFGPTPPSDPMATGGFPAGGARGTLSSALCPSDPVAADGKVWALGSSDDLQPDGSLSVTLSAEQLTTALMTDLYVDQFGNRHGGFDLGLPINLEFDVTRGATSLKAVKRILFWFPPLVPVIAGEIPNATPVIRQVQHATARDENAVLQDLALFDIIDRPEVRPGGSLWIVPSLAEQEPYLTTVVDKATGEIMAYPVEKETLRYSYFATAGKFNPSTTGTDLGRGGKWKDGLPHVESKYEAPALADVPLDPETQQHDVTWWIVVRDDRGGSSWVEGHLRVTEP